MPHSAPGKFNLQKFLDWLLEPTVPLPPEQRHQARLLMSSLLFLIVIGVAYQLFFAWLVQSAQGLLEGIGSVAVMLAAYLLCRRGYQKIAAAMAVFLLYAAIIMVVANTPTPQHNIGFLKFAAIPLLIAGIFFSNATIRYIAILFSAGEIAWVLLSISPQYLIDLFADPLPFLWIVTGIINVANRHRSRIEAERRAELQRNEEKFRVLAQNNELILASTAEGILGLDLQGDHVFVNAAAARMLGYEVEELIGKPSHATWHHSKPDGTPYPDEECPILATYREGVGLSRSSEVFWRKDGSSFPVEYASAPIYENDKLAGAVVTFTNITERKRAERALQTYGEQLAAVVKIEHALAASLDSAVIYDNLLQGAQRLFPDVATIFISTFDAKRQVIQAARGLQDGVELDVSQLPEIPLAPEGKGTQSRVIRNREPLIINAELKAATRGVTSVSVGVEDGRETQSAIYVPMLAQEQVLGLLQCQSYEVNRFTEEDIKTLALIANTAAVSIQNARLFETAQNEVRERREAEDALKLSEEKYRLITEKVDDVVWAMDVNLKFIYISPAAERVLGYSQTDALSLFVTDILDAQSITKLTDTLKKRLAVKDSAGAPGIYKMKHKQGHWVDVEVLSTPSYDTKGNLNGFVGVTRDITERIQAETEIAALHQLTQATIDALSAHICVLDQHGAIVSVNRAWREFADNNPPALPEYGIGTNYLAVCDATSGADEETAREAASALRALLRGEKNEYRLEYPCHSPQEKRWFILIARRFESYGKPYLVISHENITLRIQAEESVRQSERRLREAQSIGRIGDWEIDMATGKLFYSEQMCALLERDPALGAPEIADALYYLETEERRELQNLIMHAMETGEGWQHDSRVVLPSGREIWHRGIGKVTKDGYGNIVKVLGVAQDVTESKRAEKELRESRERFYKIFQASPAGIALSDIVSGKMFDVNEAFAGIFEYAREELIGRTSEELNLWEDPNERKTALAQLMRGERVKDHTLRVVKKSGARAVVKFSAELLDLEGKKYLLGNYEDITERVNAEQEIRLANERFTEIANHIQDVFWVDDPHTSQSNYVSPAFESIFGIKYAEVQNMPDGYLGLLEPEDRPILLAARKRELTGERSEREYRIRRPDGAIRWLREIGAPVFDQDGKVARVVGVTRDITEQVQAEDRLRESELRFRQMAENIREIFWIFDREAHKHAYANPAYESAFEVSAAELWADPNIFSKKVLPEDRQRVLDALEKQQRGERSEIEYRIQRRDGSIRWLWDRSFPIYDERGKLIRTAGVATDITERKRADDEIRQRVRDMETLYESGLTLAQILSPKQIGRKIIELLEEKMDWHHTVIRLYDPANDTLRILAVSIGAESQSTRSVFPSEIKRIGEGLSGWAVQHSTIVRSGDIASDPRYVQTFPGMNSGIYVPMRSRRRLVGVISIESEQPDAFSEANERLVATLANQAAVALENAQLNADLERRVRERTAEIQTIRQRLELATRAAGLGVWDWNVQADELIWDEQMFIVNGMDKANFAGKVEDANRHVHPQDADNITRFSTNLLEGAERGQAAFRILRDDGGISYVETSAIAVRDAQGNIAHVIGVSRDVTQETLAEHALRKSRDELSAANAALEKAARMKDEFLASMSHELRTPLTGILGFSEALQMRTYGELSEKQYRAVKHIEDSGRHLLELINDILDLSKIGAGKLELSLSFCSLADICQASLQITKGMAQQKRQTVSYDAAPEPVMLRADARRLKQILVNLIGNAVKFTPEGGELGLEVHPDRNGRRVRLVVWDKGIGIKPEDMSALFKPFVQIDSSLAREYGGTGLGLSLVRHLTEMHNGGIEVESEPRQGSRFIVTLPWSPENTTPTPYPAPHVSAEESGVEIGAARARQPQVMIADDNESVLQMIADFLEARRYRVAKARSGVELLERVADIRPDIVLVDIQMPGIDGMETIRRLRAHTDAAIASMPIIAVTALAMSGDRERCLAAGASEYASKPLNLKELPSLIERVIGGKL